MIRMLRRFLLKWDISSLELRIYEDQRAVDVWPMLTKPAYQRELSRLKQKLDRLNGRTRNVVSYQFIGSKESAWDELLSDPRLKQCMENARDTKERIVYEVLTGKKP